MSPPRTIGTHVNNDDDAGRRNWLKCAVVQDVTHQTHKLFVGGCLTQAVLSGLTLPTNNPVQNLVTTKIEELLQKQKLGQEVEVELDILLTISMLPLPLQTLCQQKNPYSTTPSAALWARR